MRCSIKLAQSVGIQSINQITVHYISSKKGIFIYKRDLTVADKLFSAF